MTMAKPDLAQDQTVEEILASIRQVINGDQSRPALGAARPATGAQPAPRTPAAAPPPQRGGTLTALHGGKAATTRDEAPRDVAPGADEDETPPPVDRSQMHDVIEFAIEQALDAVKPDETRAETGNSPPASARMQPEAPMRPRVEPRPVRETPRPVEPQPAREAPRAVQPAPRPAPAPPPASRSLLSPRANAAVAASFGDLNRVLASRGARDIDQAVEDLLRPMLKSWLEDNLPSLVERLVREEIERVSRGGR